MQPQTELLTLIGPREHEALLLQEFRRDYGAQVRKGAVTKPVDMVRAIVQVSHGGPFLRAGGAGSQDAKTTQLKIADQRRLAVLVPPAAWRRPQLLFRK